MTVGERIKEVRLARGMTQEELAKAVGTVKQTIYKYENGVVTNIPLNRLEDIASKLEVSAAFLMGWENNIGETDVGLAVWEIARKHGTRWENVEDIMDGRPTHDCLNPEIMRAIRSELQAADLIEPPAPEKKAGRGVKIPVLGTVAAGIPIEAVEDILDYEEIEPELAATGEFFALQIKGDSMEPRMQSGDVVIVRQQPDVESGDVAVVLINGDEATVKKLLKQSGGIVLQAFNPAYDPMFFSPQDIEEKPVRVIGKVIELRGKF